MLTQASFIRGIAARAYRPDAARVPHDCFLGASHWLGIKASSVLGQR